MDINTIKIDVKEIIKKNLLTNIDEFGDQVYDENLLGGKLQLQARDLVKLFFEIEKKFEIELLKCEILEGKFNTINSISEIISKSITNNN